MSVTDRKLDPQAAVAKKELVVPLITATTITDRAFYVFRPGYSFELRGLRGFCQAEAGAVTVNAILAPPNSVLTAGAVTVHSTPEQLATALARVLVGGRAVEIGAGTALAFTAAHVVAQDKYGVILLQRSNAGAWSTKVPAATPTTAMAFDTANQALAALPKADAGKVAIGHLLIKAKTGSAWTAITDDLTNGSDLETVVIATYAAQARALSSALAFVGGEEVVGTRATNRNVVRGNKEDCLVLLYTTDGSGALTNGTVTALLSARPGAGQSSFE